MPTDDNPIDREDIALDALIVACLSDVPVELIGEPPYASFMDADPEILSDEDRAAIDALGDDLIDQLLARREAT